MLVNSVISVAYYFAVPKQMLFEPASGRVAAAIAAARERRGRCSTLVAIVAVFVFPNPIARAADISTLIGG